MPCCGQHAHGDELPRAEDMLALLVRAGKLLSSSLRVEDTLANTTRLLVPAIADFCVVYEMHEDGTVAVAASAHADVAGEALLQRIFATGGLAPDAPVSYPAVLRSGRSLLVKTLDPAMHDAMARSPEQRALLDALGVRSGMAIPLHADGKMLGILTLALSTSGRQYDVRDLTFCEELAHRIAVALTNARLYDAAERERGRIERLQAFTASLSAARTTDEVIQAIVTEGRMAFRAARVCFAWSLPGEAAFELVRMEGFTSEIVSRWAGRRISLENALPIADILRRDVPIYCEGPNECTERYPDLRKIRDVGTDSIAGVPIHCCGSTIGALLLVYDTPKRFSRDDRREVDAFARLCGQAIERARLLETAQVERRRAEEASRAKDVFLATMSHELRTPLTAILGWAAILRSRVPPPETLAKALEVIERNARVQAQLIDDLLDVTRILAGSMRIEVQEVDPRVVVEAALDVVRPMASAKSVSLTASLDEAVGPLRADPVRLQQVVWNLLSNAVKFTPPGGRITISLRGDDERVEIAVEDTGKGISSSFLPHVFEPFRQAETGMTRAQGGLGLGLSIVRHLVELHGGTIEATSAGVAKGARFVVRLPRRKACCVSC